MVTAEDLIVTDPEIIEGYLKVVLADGDTLSIKRGQIFADGRTLKFTSDDGLDQIAAVKLAMDPKGLLNPGNMTFRIDKDAL
jgi:hypothetical protein